jgi:hypothetical protein
LRIALGRVNGGVSDLRLEVPQSATRPLRFGPLGDERNCSQVAVKARLRDLSRA